MVTGIQDTDPACLVACSFGADVPRLFVACWAGVSWSRAEGVGEPGTRSAGNSRRLTASSSVTKTGVIRTFGGNAVSGIAKHRGKALRTARGNRGRDCPWVAASNLHLPPTPRLGQQRWKCIPSQTKSHKTVAQFL